MPRLRPPPLPRPARPDRRGPAPGPSRQPYSTTLAGDVQGASRDSAGRFPGPFPASSGPLPGGQDHGVVRTSLPARRAARPVKGTATFGQGEPRETALSSTGNRDVFVARYAADGTLVWAKRAGGAGTGYGVSATTLFDDSVVVTGSFSGSVTLGPGERNETSLTSAGDSDVFAARFYP